MLLETPNLYMGVIEVYNNLSKELQVVYKSNYFFLLFFSFFILLRCHFQRICPFFFHLRELLFIF